MKKILLLGGFIAVLATPVAAKQINKIVWLTTTSITQSEIEEAKQAAGRFNFHYFKIDESEKIRAYFESLFPRELLEHSDSEKNAYLAKNITPRIKAYAPEMMRAEMGITLAKMYRIERIPAVVINDKFVTYGVSVSDSVKAFNAR